MIEPDDVGRFPGVHIHDHAAAKNAVPHALPNGKGPVFRVFFQPAAAEGDIVARPVLSNPIILYPGRGSKGRREF